MGGVNSTDQEFINKLTEIIYLNLGNEHFGVDELAREARMHRSYMHRKLVEFTTKSSRQFIRDVRLQKAMEMLNEDGVTASDVAYKTGFGSPAYFNTCFHEYFGYSPGRVIRLGKESRELAVEETTGKTDLESPEQSGSKQSKPCRKKTSRLIFIFISISLFILVLHVSYFMYTKYFKYPNSIAVLPFDNLSDIQETQNFADALMVNISNNLIEIHGLKVTPPISVEQFRKKIKTAPQIAKILHVDLLLEGTVQRQNNKAIVMVTLISAVKDQQIWAQKLDCDLSDSFRAQTVMAKNIADDIQDVIMTKTKTLKFRHHEKKNYLSAVDDLCINGIQPKSKTKFATRDQTYVATIYRK